MKLIRPTYEILTPLDREKILTNIEKVGRVCYKSEDKITNNSASTFVRMLVKRGHEAMIEHINLSVKFIVDRGVSHEIVRHRIASYAQESTRYCNYSNDKFNNQCTFIIPPWLVGLREGKYTTSVNISSTLRTLLWWRDGKLLPTDESGFYQVSEEGDIWLSVMHETEKMYFKLLECGWSPQQARSVLPNSTKTEIVMTANLREWRHFLKLRTDIAAHPQMREVACPLGRELEKLLPEIFEGCVYNN